MFLCRSEDNGRKAARDTVAEQVNQVNTRSRDKSFVCKYPACGKEIPKMSKGCPCQIVHYCGRECQVAHWPGKCIVKCSSMSYPWI